MKVLSACLLCLFFIGVHVHAADLQAEFIISSDLKQINEGDFIEGTLKIWPIENPDYEEFKKLINLNFFNSLILTQIQSIGSSPNNADLLEIKGLFLAKASGEMISLPMNYKGQSFTVPLPSFKLIPLKNKSQDFFIVNQSFTEKSFLKLILSIFGILLAAAFWKRKVIKDCFKKFNQDPNLALTVKYQQLFLRASTREDFENIYLNKENWLKLIPVTSTEHDNFFETINKYQYKKYWESSELEEVRLSFEVIRGSIL